MGFVWRWPVKLLLWLLGGPLLTLIWAAVVLYVYVILQNEELIWWVVGGILPVYLLQLMARGILNNWEAATPKQPKPKKRSSKVNRKPVGSLGSHSSSKQMKFVLASIAVPSTGKSNSHYAKMLKQLSPDIQTFILTSQEQHTNKGDTNT